MQLGNATLDFESLVKRAASIKSWGNALTETGDILFYGCDLAASAEGKSLLDALSRLTGADVAASEDPTGSAAEGGDWDLEFRTGAIEAQLAVAAAGQSEWDHLLAVPTFVAAGAVGDGTAGVTPALPAGLATNDILLLFVETANQAVAIANQNGGTWTEVTNSPQGSGTAAAIDATRLTVFWSRYNGTQGAPTTTDSGDHQFGRIYAFRGVVTSGTPFNISSGSTEATSDTSLSATGATTTAADSLVVIGATISMELGTENFGGTWTNASLTNITVRGNDWGTQGNDGRLAVVTGDKVTAGAYGATTNTLTVGSEKGMMTIALTGNSATYNVSGTVYNDVDADAAVGEVGEGTFRNVTVRLYRDDGDGVIEATDPWVQDVTTNASGQYTFANVADGYSYWVVADSKTIGDPADVGAYLIGNLNNVWAEQTYGDDWSTGGAVDLGARYGGRNAATSDNASALLTSEHVARVAVSGAAVSGVNYGFSFNAIVNTRGDNTDDDGVNARMQQGSLRQFLLNSNALAGVQSSEFQIGAVGSAQTINPAGASLPTITDTVILNAWTQGAAGYSGAPLITLDGNNLAGIGLQLTATADNSTIRGFVIRDFGSDGIRIDSGSTGNTIAGNYIGRLTNAGADAGAGEGNGDDGIDVRGSGNTIGGTGANDGNVISGNGGAAGDGIEFNGAGATGNVALGNRIGTNAAGTTAIGNTLNGIRMTGGAGSNTIGGGSVAARNVVSGNGNDGIYLDASSSNLILGNYFGVNAAGTGALGNAFSGVSFGSGSNNNTVGGTGANDGNVISGNSEWGIWSNFSDGNTIQGNRIGTNAAGTGAIANLFEGILLYGSDGNTVGGAAAGAGNLISGNAGFGLHIDSSSSNVVLGNYVGVTASGIVDLGNNGDGIVIQDSSNNTIGGTTAAARNVVSGNAGLGISLDNAGTTGNVVSGNYIGVGADGTTAIGNDNNGIRVNNGAANNTIGGTAAGAGNLISNNQWGGIYLIDGGTAGAGNRMLGNVSYSNPGDQGITLQGFAGNDGTKTAGEANLFMDTPVFTSASLAGTLLTVGGYIGTAAGDTDFANSRVEIFKSNAAGDGLVYLGFLTSNVANGNFFGTIDVTGLGLAAGNTITGTATDTVGNTSEYGANFTVPVPTYLISGTVYNDVDADAVVAEAGEGTFRNVAVRLYQDDGDGVIEATDAFVTSTTTNASGVYTFSGLTDGLTYWVAVNSRQIGDPLDIAYNGGFGINNVWAEQTYGDDSSTAAVDLGARYGGRNAGTSDNTPAGLLSAEHVARVGLSGANVAGVNWGFSFSTIVNNRGDNTDDDSGKAGTQQQGTLRQFILNANAISGVQSAEFQIGAVGSAQSIALGGAEFATITDAVRLDAWTQGAPGYNGAPLIELNGLALGAGADGLTIQATNGASLLRGFVINRFTDSGILVNGATGVTIQGNYIGTNTAGNAASSNNRNGGGVNGDGDAIQLLNASNNTIGGMGTGERNVLSGNDSGAANGWEHGVYLWDSDNNLTEGNYIGTNAAGTGALRNFADGIGLDGSAGGGYSNGNTIRNNLISGNKEYGIWAGANSGGQIIRGNLIGTNAAGAAAVPNGTGGSTSPGGAGIRLDSASNTIGGTNAADRNVISGNSGANSYGIVLNGTGANNNLIQGNYIGTNAAGTGALANQRPASGSITARPTRSAASPRAPRTWSRPTASTASSSAAAARTATSSRATRSAPTSPARSTSATRGPGSRYGTAPTIPGSAASARATSSPGTGSKASMSTASAPPARSCRGTGSARTRAGRTSGTAPTAS